MLRSGLLGGAGRGLRPSNSNGACHGVPLSASYLAQPCIRAAPLRATAADDGSEPSTSGSGGGGGGVPSGDAGSEGSAAAAAAALNRLFYGGGGALTGPELTELIRGKWGGRSFEARLRKKGRRVFIEVMWKFLEQQSFHMTKDEYDAQMAAVADIVSEWGAADFVRRAIAADKSRGPGYTAGGSARAVSIPLPVDTSGARSGEWGY